jgi:hypothetical protein
MKLVRPRPEDGSDCPASDLDADIADCLEMELELDMELEMVREMELDAAPAAKHQTVQVHC